MSIRYLIFSGDFFGKKPDFLGFERILQRRSITNGLIETKRVAEDVDPYNKSGNPTVTVEERFNRNETGDQGMPAIEQ